MHTANSKDNERHQLIEDLKQKCEMVEEAIKVLTSSRVVAEDNAAEIKASIMNDATLVLESLRRREVQLIRQVDVVETHHLNKLQTHHAKLYQLLGNLRHTLYCAENQQSIPTSNICSTDMELARVIREKKIIPDLITYSANTQDMNSAIRDFGVVTTAPTNLLAFNNVDGLMSKCLPSKMEEYEEGEQQQLLYKTLEEVKEEQRSYLSKEYFTVPKLLSDVEEWLKACTATAMAVPMSNFCLPEFLQSQDLSFWLKSDSSESCSSDQDLKEWSSAEWLIHDDHQMDVPEKCGYDVLSSVSSESIEMISHSDTVTASPTSQRRNSKVTDDFIFVPGFENLHLHLKKDTKECCHSCDYEDPTMDIENLANIGINPQLTQQASEKNDCIERWLVSRCQWPTTLPDVPVNEVCSANEPCRDYNDCVCREKCFEKVFEKRMQQLHIDKNFLFRANTAKSMQQSGEDGVKSLWLRNEAPLVRDFVNSWLSCTSVGASDLPEKAEKESSNMERGVNPDVWCKSGADVSNKETLLLAPSTTMQNVADYEVPIRDDFKRYFHAENVDNWLKVS